MIIIMIVYVITIDKDDKNNNPEYHNTYYSYKVPNAASRPFPGSEEGARDSEASEEAAAPLAPCLSAPYTLKYIIAQCSIVIV